MGLFEVESVRLSFEQIHEVSEDAVRIDGQRSAPSRDPANCMPYHRVQRESTGKGFLDEMPALEFGESGGAVWVGVAKPIGAADPSELEERIDSGVISVEAREKCHQTS
jgi:hypothetical protein